MAGRVQICCALPARPAATRWQCSPAAGFVRDCFADVLSGSTTNREGFWRKGFFPVWYQSRGSG